MLTARRTLLVILAGLTAVAPAGAAGQTVDATTRFVLRARRYFPDILRDSAAHNINLAHLAERGRALESELRDKLGPQAPRPPRVTIRVRRMRPTVMTETFVDAKSLGARADRFRGIATRFGPALDRRARVLARILDLLLRAPTEDELVELIRYAVWTQDLDEKVIDERLKTFDAGALRAFEAPAEFHERIGRLKGELSVNGRRGSKLGKVVDRLRKRVRRGVVEHRTRLVTLPIETLIMTELDPELAQLKGYFAHDCSSRECLGYPMAPGERTFALMSEDRAPRGAAAFSRARLDGRPTLFVNTLSGLRLGEDLARMALRGFREIATDSAGLSMPTTERVRENFNFEPMVDFARTLTASAAYGALDFPDASSRRIIESYSLRPYDAIERHPRAHPIDLAALDDPNLEVMITEGGEFDGTDRRPFSNAEFVTAMLELIASMRPEMARDFWTRAGRAVTEAQRLIDLVTNLDGEPRAVWTLNLERRLIELGLPLDTARAWAHDTNDFRIGQLVSVDGLAPDARAGTLASMVREAEARPLTLRLPTFTAWLNRLDGSSRNDLLYTLLRALEERRLDPDRDSVWPGFLVHLTNARNLEIRAREFIQRGLHWATLINAAEALAGTTEHARHQDADRATVNLITRALRATTSAAQFATVFRDVIANYPDTARVISGLGAAVDHLRTLDPSPRALEDIGRQFDGVDVLRRVMNAGATEFRRAADLLDAAAALVIGTNGHRAAVVRAAFAARADEFLALSPTPAELARFRELATVVGSTDERTWLTRLFETEVTPRVDLTWADLAALVRPDRAGLDQGLTHAARPHLDRLVNLFERADLAARGCLDHGPADALARMVRRQADLRRATTPAAWLSVLESSPKPELTVAQVRAFVKMGAGITDVREAIRLTGDPAGFGRAVAPLVHDAEDLAALTARLDLGPEETSILRAEFVALIQEVMRAPGAVRRFTELDIDRVMTTNGLDTRRGDVPPLMRFTSTRPTCEVALSAMPPVRGEWMPPKTP